MCIRHACILHGDYRDSPDYKPFTLSEEAKRKLDELKPLILVQRTISSPPGWCYGHPRSEERKTGGHVFEIELKE